MFELAVHNLPQKTEDIWNKRQPTEEISYRAQVWSMSDISAETDPHILHQSVTSVTDRTEEEKFTSKAANSVLNHSRTSSSWVFADWILCVLMFLSSMLWRQSPVSTCLVSGGPAKTVRHKICVISPGYDFRSNSNKWPKRQAGHHVWSQRLVNIFNKPLLLLRHVKPNCSPGADILVHSVCLPRLSVVFGNQKVNTKTGRRV